MKIFYRRPWLQIYCNKYKLNISWKFIAIWFTAITRNAFTHLKSMQICLFTSATSHLTFAHETSVTSSEHHEHEGTPAWTKVEPSSSRRSHWKHIDISVVEMRHLIACVTLCVSVLYSCSSREAITVLLHSWLFYQSISGLFVNFARCTWYEED